MGRCASTLTASLTSGTASAQDKVYTNERIGIPTINNASHQFARNSPPRSNGIPAAASNPRSFRRANWATIPRMIGAAYQVVKDAARRAQ